MRRILPLSRRKLTTAVGAAAIALTLTVSGCTVNPSDIPAPGAATGGPFSLHVEFSSVLNLPDRARVMANGVQVGRLTSVTLKSNSAVANLALKAGTQIPTDSVAELRQDTILGDIYIYISTPTNGFGSLYRSGGTIPLAQTKKPVQIEDLLVGLSNFLGSGSLFQLGSTFRRLNGQFPDDPNETKKITAVMSQQIIDLGHNTDSINAILEGLNGTASTLLDNIDVVDGTLSAEGVQFWGGAIHTATGVLDVLKALSGLNPPLVSTLPLLSTTTTAVNTVLKPLLFPGWPNTNGRTANLTNLQNLLLTKVVPFFEKGAKLNVTAVSNGPGVPDQDQVNQIIKTLRMIGAIQ